MRFKEIIFSSFILLSVLNSCEEVSEDHELSKIYLKEQVKQIEQEESTEKGNLLKKKSKKIIIPQVIPPDPDPEPWPDPYPVYWEPIDPPMPIDPEPPIYVEPVLIAEQEAVFPGGQAEMMKFIKNNIKISEYDLELGCQGKVYVRIVVTSEGKITNPEVLKGIQGCPGLSKSALDVVALMPDWTPAANNGQKVSSYYTFPIVIKYE